MVLFLLAIITIMIVFAIYTIMYFIIIEWLLQIDRKYGITNEHNPLKSLNTINFFIIT